LPASLDLLLTRAILPFPNRMEPDGAQRHLARFGANLAIQPGAVTGRAATLLRELGTMAGKSHRAPGTHKNA
jgi:polyhydroxyalkanoate synthase